jgi:hypothetical protein
MYQGKVLKHAHKWGPHRQANEIPGQLATIRHFMSSEVMRVIIILVFSVCFLWRAASRWQPEYEGDDEWVDILGFDVSLFRVQGRLWLDCHGGVGKMPLMKYYISLEHVTWHTISRLRQNIRQQHVIQQCHFCFTPVVFDVMVSVIVALFGKQYVLVVFSVKTLEYHNSCFFFGILSTHYTPIMLSLIVVYAHVSKLPTI